jgi:hypothetical protein
MRPDSQSALSWSVSELANKARHVESRSRGGWLIRSREHSQPTERPGPRPFPILARSAARVLYPEDERPSLGQAIQTPSYSLEQRCFRLSQPLAR